MAGTDQSANLGGMLNQIAGTLESGYTINGKNAGAAIGDVIANAVRPEVDTKDPVSMMKYAEWARNNGRNEEALRYTQMADQRSSQQEALAAAKAADQISNEAKAYGAKGSILDYDREIGKLRQVQANAQTPEQYDAITRRISALEQQRPQVSAQNVQNKARQVSSLDAWRDRYDNDSSIPEDVKRRVAAQREAMLNQPDVAKAVRANATAEAQAQLQQGAAREQARQEFVNSGFSAAKEAGGETFEKFKEQADQMGAGHLVEQAEAADMRAKATELAYTEALSEWEAPVSTGNLEALYSATTISEDDPLSTAYDAVLNEVEEFNNQDPGERSEAWRSEKKNLAGRVKVISDQIANRIKKEQELAASARNRAGETVKQLNVAIAKVGQNISQQELDNYILTNFGTAIEEDLKEWGWGKEDLTEDKMREYRMKFGEQAREGIIARETAALKTARDEAYSTLGGGSGDFTQLFLTQLAALKEGKTNQN